MKKFDFNFDSFKSFDWRSLKKYFTPQATEDLSRFLERLPQYTGQNILIAAGIAWAAAGALGLYTTVQIQKLTEMRVELQEAEALKPIVPVIRDVEVSREDIAEFVDKTSKIYIDLSIKASGSDIVIGAKSTGQFGAFREAVGHVQNGGSGWRVNIKRLCVGRECKGEPLSASLTIGKVSVEKPA